MCPSRVAQCWNIGLAIRVEWRKGCWTKSGRRVNLPAQNQSHPRRPQTTRTDAHRSATTSVRCITQHITYPQVVKVGGHLLPCLNFMYKICMHNNPCQMPTGDGLTARIFLKSAAGHFPRSWEETPPTARAGAPVILVCPLLPRNLKGTRSCGEPL